MSKNVDVGGSTSQCISTGFCGLWQAPQTTRTKFSLEGMRIPGICKNPVAFVKSNSEIGPDPAKPLIDFFPLTHTKNSESGIYNPFSNLSF